MHAQTAQSPQELPHAAAARSLWIGPRSPHRSRLDAAAPWVLRWRGLGRGSEVAIAWDGSADASVAVWVATRLGLAVTVVCDAPLPSAQWQELDDQAVTYGGDLRWVQSLPAGLPVVRPAA